jgi:inhibitor of KinA sporulation pathway (predicted exonuclease)
MPKYTRYAVIDLEATCSDDKSIPRSKCEIIEIGGVLVDAVTLEWIEEFQAFVKPVLYPKLTEFCTKLTTITQADVDGAEGFATVLARLAPWFADGKTLFCSWGDYDNNQFALDAKRHGVLLPFSAGHLNVKRAFAERRAAELGVSEKFGNREAMDLVGVTATGIHHRGIDDARNIARLLPWCLPASELGEGLYRAHTPAVATAVSVVAPTVD